VGVADLLTAAIVAESNISTNGPLLTAAEARKRIWLVDSLGLVTSDRDMQTLQAHKVPYAHDLPATTTATADTGTTSNITTTTDTTTGTTTYSIISPLHKKGHTQSHLDKAVTIVRPTILLGMSAQPSSFTQSICQQMAALNKKPIIFALSNPTDKSECSAADAYKWTNGQCIFASGNKCATLNI
jgi:malate dehydrogenase (oxaloacetate-decarboxylating)(NADP+)